MQIDDREKFDSSQLGAVGLSIHQALDHLNNLLLKVLYVDQ